MRKLSIALLLTLGLALIPSVASAGPVDTCVSKAIAAKVDIPRVDLPRLCDITAQVSANLKVTLDASAKAALSVVADLVKMINPVLSAVLRLLCLQ